MSLELVVYWSQKRDYKWLSPKKFLMNRYKIGKTENFKIENNESQKIYLLNRSFWNLYRSMKPNIDPLIPSDPVYHLEVGLSQDRVRDRILIYSQNQYLFQEKKLESIERNEIDCQCKKFNTFILSCHS